MPKKRDLKGLLVTVAGAISFVCTSLLVGGINALEPSDAVLDIVFILVLFLIGSAFGVFAAAFIFGR